MRVLVVEDDPDTLSGLIRRLKAKISGAEIVSATNVRDATALMELHHELGRHFQAIILDFRLPLEKTGGSPEVDDVIPQITAATVGADNKSVRLTFDKLTKGHIHELHLDGVKSADGRPVLHPVAYYTLNEIPAK